MKEETNQTVHESLKKQKGVVPLIEIPPDAVRAIEKILDHDGTALVKRENGKIVVLEIRYRMAYKEPDGFRAAYVRA